MSEKSPPDEVEDVSSVIELATVLADAMSKASKYANQLWLVVIIVSGAIIFPKAGTAPCTLALPFSLADVPNNIFRPLGFLILFILIMAFLIAYAQAQYVARFAEARIKALKKENAIKKAREFYNALNVATYARVWPLVLGAITHTKRLDARGAVFFHIVLKFFALAIILGLPLSALIKAHANVGSEIFWRLGWVAWLFIFISVLTVLIGEFQWLPGVFENAGKITKKGT